MIDHGGDVPVYRQLAQTIIGRIGEGLYQPGRAIPSEKTLGQEFEVSRDTVRRAVAWLRSEGWIHTVPHRGSYVRRRD